MPDMTDILKGSTTGLLVGAGVMLAAPIVVPAVLVGARPVAKWLIRGYLAAAAGTREMVAEARERGSDLVAEARSERNEALATTAGAAGGAKAASGSRSRSRSSSSKSKSS